MKTRRQKRSNSYLQHPYVKKETSNAWVRNKLNGNGNVPNWKVLQSGGGFITQEGYTFLYDDEGDTILCVARKPYKGMCFKITFSEEDASIGVDISYSKGCSQNKDLPKSSGTLIMLRAILELILTRKNIAHYKSIVITDNSSIECVYDSKSYEIKLMDMYFVSTGCTWYSSLAPMFLRKESDEKRYLEQRSRIISSLSWDEFVNLLPENVRDVINTVIQFHDECTRYEPAYTMLNKIRKNDCILFHLYLHDFLMAFGAESLAGKEWCIPLKKGKIVVCEEDIMTKCKHPDKGYVIPSVLMKSVSLEEYNSLKKSIQIANIPYNFVLEKNFTKY